MALTSEVQAALVAAAVSLFVAIADRFHQFWQKENEQRRMTRIQYLYPLKIACEDLLKRWGKINKEINKAKEDHKTLSPDEARKAIQLQIGKPFYEAKNKVRAPGFYGDCNDYLCGPIGTMYATAVYFAYATKLRDQLPLIRIPQKKALLLLQLTEGVRAGLGAGDSAAFWSEIQDSIGHLVKNESGYVESYSAFCRSLGSDFELYSRLFNFYIDISLKADYQLKSGNESLQKLHRELDRLLETGNDSSGNGATAIAG